MSNFSMDGYIDVAQRIVEFREKHPDGSLQPADLTQPYTVEQLGDQTFLVVVAAAYRSNEDTRPGIGMAYEQYPGRTPYTRGSELQNAETSAWGRAIVAVLAADTKKGVASAEEVRNRSAEREQPEREPSEADKARQRVRAYCDENGIKPADVAAHFKTQTEQDIREADAETLDAYLETLKEVGIEVAA